MTLRKTAFSLVIILAMTGCVEQTVSAQSRTPIAATAQTVVPTIVPYSGATQAVDGKPLTGEVAMTFQLFKEETGGEPLWTESQQITVDPTGHYKAELGASLPSGLPLSTFASGEGRWLEVQIAGQAPQARVMLMSVPYAMKAADAATLGGLPASAFALAGSPSSMTLSNGTAASPNAGSTVTTTGGTSNYIPIFTGASTIANSEIYDTGTSVGVGGVPNASAKLDVKGSMIMRGNMIVSRSGNATAAKGYPSYGFDFFSNVYNSSTNTTANPYFALESEPAGNNTSSPSATFNLRYSATGTEAETGFYINPNGVVHFATGQTFPGGGGGTITGVTAGTDLTGGGTSGAVTLNLDTTKVPLLTTNNAFSGTEQFKGAVGIGTTPQSNGYTPLTIGTTNTFGTWLALANASTGGHTWNLISAGSGNAEGAGNVALTDLTGKSTIYLEGNTTTTNLTASAGLNAATLVVTSTAGASIIDADGFGANAGGPTPGLRFGGGGSGEGIASNRTIGATKDGLDFYTNFTRRMSVLQNGQVAVGTASPGAQLGVISSTNAPAIYAQGGAAASGSGQNGGDGIDAIGSTGDGDGDSGEGIVATGGPGLSDGIVASAGSSTGDFGPYAGYFTGDIAVNGSVDSNSVRTQMDHPLDPANKYLIHASVESSEMKNMYDGTVTSDASGEAVVELPDWFEALNRDFRYQLTVIGQFAQAIVSSEIANHQFTIKTDKPGVKVSWQVTGVRQDAYAKAHPVSVEALKPGREAGHYLHPELYGAPEEMSIEWARHPEMMKKIKAHREQQKTQLAVK
jgi:hypothetical protein